MGKSFLILISIITFTGLQAQIYTEDGRYELTGKDDKNLYEASGSPFLNEKFVPGKIFFEGKPPLTAPLRYNIYNETIEIKINSEKEEIFKVSDRERVTYELAGQRIISTEFSHDGNKVWGFFIEHYDGEQYQLLEKPIVKVSPPIRSESGYSEDQPAQMKKSSTFYIINRAGHITNVRLKHRDVKKAFRSPMAKEYLSDNKIKELEDLVAFLKFLDVEQQ